ncbi:MAG: hypothetical protein R2822_25405 [Spirosomataceae bacterium]
MAFTLIAATMTNGYGIVADANGEIYLIKPPFGFHGKEYLPYEQIKPTISQFGFTELNEDFLTWEAVFERLRQIAWQARREVGDTNTTISEEDKKAFFRSIPKGFLIGAVEKIESYLAKGDYYTVLFVGEALLENSNLNENESLQIRVKQAFDEAKQKQEDLLSPFKNFKPDRVNRHFNLQMTV